ncbi:hypothetical protein Cgig2_029015 [Carnegiea gigantea]|uniref:Uncharacterized protein n=1 Tax=Carnegiea gigantea TaxID=171969 RepID=A0A9Q1JWD2_9CARY|nr:hypothetical protein Cgig2_029015 [Carnegiea gigantea]
MPVWLVRNFDICSCSLPLANGRMRLTKHDVNVTLGFPMDPLERYGYLEDTLDKTSITGEEEQVIKNEYHSKGVEDEGKAEDQTLISKVKAPFWDGRAATDLIITNNQRLAKVITELEEFIPGARSPLKRVRKVAVESVSDALIRDRLTRSEDRTPIDAIEKHFMGSREMVHDFPQFVISSFILGVSQEEKEVLPVRIVVVDSQPDILVAIVQKDNDAFVDRSLMRIVEPDLQIRHVQTTTNIEKGKVVLAEASKRRRTSVN